MQYSAKWFGCNFIKLQGSRSFCGSIADYTYKLEVYSTYKPYSIYRSNPELDSETKETKL